MSDILLRGEANEANLLQPQSSQSASFTLNHNSVFGVLLGQSLFSGATIGVVQFSCNIPVQIIKFKNFDLLCLRLYLRTFFSVYNRKRYWNLWSDWSCLRFVTMDMFEEHSIAVNKICTKSWARELASTFASLGKFRMYIINK